MEKIKNERLWEIDFLRGIAILMMITYHLIFDLNYFNLVTTDLHAVPILLFLYPIGTLFLLLVGLSLTLSYSRVNQTLTPRQLHIKFLNRGGWIFSLGLLITLVTWFYPHNSFIVFGVLHCIGLSIIVAYPLIRYRIAPLLLGVVCILVGIILQIAITVDFPWLLWLGLPPADFSTLDYFPLLPWFGVVLIGIFLGNSFYKHNKRTFSIKEYSKNIVIRGICFLGRYSLIIYLVHQLVIIGLLYLLFL